MQTLLAVAISLDAATVAAIVAAFVGGSAGGHVVARRKGGPVQSGALAPEREAQIRHEVQVDANIEATSKPVADLAKIVERVHEETHEHAQELTQLGLRVDLIDGGRPGGARDITGPLPIPAGVPI